MNLSTSNAQDYFNLGNICASSGEEEGAIANYSEAIRLAPNSATSYFNRGISRYLIEDKEGTLADLTQAINIKPDYAEAFCNRGVVKAELGDRGIGKLQSWTLRSQFVSIPIM